MFPEIKDSLLKEHIEIYNNEAGFGKCAGRLSVHLHIFPEPRIKWEFEVIELDNKGSGDFPRVGRNSKDHKFEGYNIYIEDISVTSDFSQSFGKDRALGFAGKATWGNSEKKAQYFEFYITNSRFMTKTSRIDDLIMTLSDSRRSSQDISAISDGLREQRSGGKFLEFKLNENWKVRLEINTEAIDLLNSHDRNIGTILTCKGEIYQIDKTDEDGLSTLEAKSIINDLCRFLSYTNCGFIAPTLIRASSLKLVSSDFGPPHKQMETSCAIADVTYQISPIDSLGIGWIKRGSDLRKFFDCFQTFQGMIIHINWRKTFYFVIVQYFQAARGNNWELCISAIDAALERLCYAILVEDLTTESDKHFKILFKAGSGGLSDEEKEAKKKLRNEKLKAYSKKEGLRFSDAEIRLSYLLEHIGLEDDSNLETIKRFRAVRNSAVHPVQDEIDDRKAWQMVEQGLQWVDEILLWRLGYDGTYLDRIKLAKMNFPLSDEDRSLRGSCETDPRYDLSTRDPEW